MKVSEIKVGVTYRNGDTLRTVRGIRGPGVLQWENKDNKTGHCSVESFAKWAKSLE